MRYLIRVNLDIDPEGASENPRFKEVIETIETFLGPQDKVVLLSHRGRPEGEDPSLSLLPFVEKIKKATKKKVKFFDSLNFKHIKEEIESGEEQIYILENLRFNPAEEKNSKGFARKLASLGDEYINDDFATSHRAHSSLSAITKYIPAQVGPHLKAEVDFIKTFIEKPMRPLVLVVGGAKSEDKLPVVEHLLEKVDKVILGGSPANTLLSARGVDMGQSVYSPKLAKSMSWLINHPKIVLPIDWREDEGKILDVGPRTIEKHSLILGEANSVIWSGPLGKFEKERFSLGTKNVINLLTSDEPPISLIGGGDTAVALQSLGPKKLPEELHISTGGGAMLTYLAGEDLPGLVALKQNV